MQAGDCFDIATILCSLLIGVGFNAFVVVGYAPPAVTLNDQADTTCPIVEREAQGAGATEGGASLQQSNAGLAAASKVAGTASGRKQEVVEIKVRKQSVQLNVGGM